jgi:hypothetical protein
MVSLLVFLKISKRILVRCPFFLRGFPPFGGLQIGFHCITELGHAGNIDIGQPLALGARHKGIINGRCTKSTSPTLRCYEMSSHLRLQSSPPHRA